jgi:hypothetical protein
MDCQEEFDRNGSQERLGSVRNVSKGFDKKGCQERLKQERMSQRVLIGRDTTKGRDRKGFRIGWNRKGC